MVKKKKLILLILLITGFLFRFLLAPWGTLWLDMNCWIGWGNRLTEMGFGNFYNSWCDYLPSYLYILWFLDQLKNHLVGLTFVFPSQVIYKLPSIFADLATAFLIFEIVQESKKKKWALWAMGIYLFNPAVWANSTLWGQTDSFFTFFLILSFYFLLKEKAFFLGLSLVFASLLKPLGFLLVPFVLLSFFKKKKMNRFFLFCFSFFTSFLLLFIPFNQESLIDFIISRFSQTFNQYPYTSLNAFNFWAMVGKMWAKDTAGGFFSFQFLGTAIFGVFYLGLLAGFRNAKTKVGKKALLLAGCFLAGFLFLTRMHERHLFPVFAFLNIAAVFYPLLFINYFLISLISVFNLYYAYILITKGTVVFSSGLISFFSFILLISFLGLFFLPKIKLKKIKLTIFSKNAGRVLSRKKILPKMRKVKQAKLLLILILVFAFTTRIINLDHPQDYVFDEVYHAFTAQEMIKGNLAAWEWWNVSPKGFAYEWTHPPLAKHFMAGGIVLSRSLGINNDFLGWRLPAAVFGAGVIFLTYRLARKIFMSERIALLAAFFLSCDGLVFVLSRVGMSDIYFTFFALLAILLAMNKKWTLMGLSWGMALAIKWTGLYLILPLFLVFIYYNWKKRLAFFKWLLVICLAIGVYFFSYLPFFTSGHSLKQFSELHRQMWGYHTRLKATHSYQSPAYTWPLNMRPVWFWVEYKEGFVSNIYALGNPVIFWSGLVFLPLFFYYALVGKKYYLFLVLACYFVFWVPWAFSPRVMFMYHYLPAVPFLVMILAWGIDYLLKNFKQSRLAVIMFMMVCLLSFFFFYPLWAGMPVNKEWVKVFFWLPTWK